MNYISFSPGGNGKARSRRDMQSESIISRFMCCITFSKATVDLRRSFVSLYSSPSDLSVERRKRFNASSMSGKFVRLFISNMLKERPVSNFIVEGSWLFSWKIVILSANSALLHISSVALPSSRSETAPVDTNRGLTILALGRSLTDLSTDSSSLET